MLAYILRRLGVSLLVLLGLSLLVFFLVRLAPGDTATAMLGARYTPQAAAEIRETYGLDQPVIVQYGIWLGRVFHGDLGRTTAGTAVTHEIADALPITIELLIISLLIATLAGIPAGAVAAARRNGPVDYAATTGGLIGLSVPNFWLGTMLILLFSLILGWLPSGTFIPFMRDPLANLRHMILPGVALGLAVAAVVMRMTRASMVQVLGEDYMRTARSKGLEPLRLFFKHGLKNAMTPVLTILGIQTGYLIGGSVVIEQVFSLNGVGRLVLRAIGDRDYALLQGVVLLIGAAFLVINLVVDLLYGVLDPRLRVDGQ